jgi:uncharacterized Zn finger protein
VSRPWSMRWAELADLDDTQVARRVAQGRAWQRSGRVTDLRFATGRASARVQGSRATPYAVELAVPPLAEEAWERVTGAIAGELRHGARLLAGLAPLGLDEELAAGGVGLFPVPADVAWRCECDDPVRPCAHAGAVSAAVARALEDDPFLLFRLRGRGRERLLADVAAARRRGPAPVQRVHRPTAAEVRAWWQPTGDLEAVSIPEVEAPRVPAAVLRILGAPPGWEGGVGAWELFRPLVAGAAGWAGGLTADPAGGEEGQVGGA